MEDSLARLTDAFEQVALASRVPDVLQDVANELRDRLANIELTDNTVAGRDQLLDAIAICEGMLTQQLITNATRGQ